MKFFSLFKKELRELVTLQTILGVAVGMLIFLLLGNVMGNMGEELSEKMGSVVIADLDGSQMSESSMAALESAGFEVHTIEGGSDIEMIKAAKVYDHSSLLVFPAGFSEKILRGESQELQIVSELTSFSIMSGNDSSATAAAEAIKEIVAATVLGSEIPGADIQFLRSPVTTVDVTVANGRSDTVNASALQGFAMQQSMFIPIIVFILITFASQLNASAIANEKGDKTLETLLSAPVSRMAVLSSKMCASGILSLLMAGVYMIGFSSYMNGMMAGVGADGSAAISQSLQSLGLQLGTMQYALLGVQLFLTLMIVLAISMILGALAKDLKAASSLMVPLMFLAMIPYFVSMFMDVSSLPLIGQILLYAIPFTHTFTASANLLFGNMVLFYAGMGYQIVFLAVVLFLAVRVFSTDKIFTMTLGEHKSRKKKAKKVA